MTDATGQFAMEVSREDHTLFSREGHETQTDVAFVGMNSNRDSK